MKAILLDEAKKWLEENCENQYTRMAVLGIMQSMPTVDYQETPNEPLTLEQLREMDGEPVWIVDVEPHKWYGPGWAIVDRDNCLVRTVKNWNAVFFESYGERWLAYAYPPTHIDREAWVCPYCTPDAEGYVRKFGAYSIHNGMLETGHCKPQKIKYCPHCSRPLTE